MSKVKIKETQLKVKSLMKEFGEQVRKIRLDQNLTMVELCEKAYISYSFLSDIENGKAQNISIHTIHQISEALDYFDWKIIQ